MRNLCVKAAVLFVIAVLTLQGIGCSYLQYRAEDAAQMVDVGLAFSAKPQVGLYLSAASLFVLGRAQVDAWLLGLGGGRVGLVPYHTDNWGFMFFGHEVHAWGDYDLGDPATFYSQQVGILPLVDVGAADSRPGYMPSGNHQLHLGWVGAVINVRLTEILDFVLGWSTYDLANDDGRELGHW